MERFVVVVHVLLFMVFCNTCNVEAQCRSFNRATDNLREVVIGKCVMFQNQVNQVPFCTDSFRNCSDIWEKFYSAFKFQPLCNVSVAGYDAYLQATDHPIPPNKALFWENVYPFVHRFSNKGAKYYTLTDTLTGYIGNGVNWCSDPTTANGMVATGTECPEWEPTPTCPQCALRAFWIAASKSFGLRARGNIYIMLNASVTPVFANDTYLAVYELPYLKENLVTKATVLMVNENTSTQTNKCNDPSLKFIEDQLAKKNIAYDCVQNRRDLADLLCLDSPASPMCSSGGATSGASHTGFLFG